MEAPAPVGAAVVGAAHAGDLVPAGLRPDSLRRVDGVGVVDHPDHPVRIDRLGAVERDAGTRGPRRATAVGSCGR